MARYLMSTIAAWFASFLLGFEASLPYVVRSMRTVSAGGKWSLFRGRLQPHYWVGYALAAVILLHASLAGPGMARSDPAGIWAATLALGLVFVQVALGLSLRDGGANPRRVRRLHFSCMVALGVLVAVHVLRNG